MTVEKERLAAENARLTELLNQALVLDIPRLRDERDAAQTENNTLRAAQEENLEVLVETQSEVARHIEEYARLEKRFELEQRLAAKAESKGDRLTAQLVKAQYDLDVMVKAWEGIGEDKRRLTRQVSNLVALMEDIKATSKDPNVVATIVVRLSRLTQTSEDS